MKKLSDMFFRYGSMFCALAVAVTKLGVLSCRGQFYQPQEPKGLRLFLRRR